jgi:hypothetical protein
MFKVEVWSGGRADLLGYCAGLPAAKAIYDRAKANRSQGEIVRLSSPQGIIAEIGDADAIEVAPRATS